jgi:hypothetical protein
VSPRPSRLAALALLASSLACGGEGASEAEAEPEAAGSETAAAPAPGMLSASQAFDRQIELWEELVTELEGIRDEAGAQAAVPRLRELSAEADQVTRSIDPAAGGASSPEQMDRLDAVRNRYAEELTRITREAPAAVPIIGDALSSAEGTE